MSFPGHVEVPRKRIFRAKLKAGDIVVRDFDHRIFLVMTSPVHTGWFIDGLALDNGERLSLCFTYVEEMDQENYYYWRV